MTQKRNESFEPVEVEVFSFGRQDRHLGRMPSFEKPNRDVPAIVFVDKPASRSAKSNEMTTMNISKTEFRLSVVGTLVGFLVIACGTTWTISNSMNEKVDKARIELNSSIQTAKTELSVTMQNNKTDLGSRLDKIETKLDTDSKDNARSLAKIQSLLENQKQ